MTEIRALIAADRPAWGALYAAYADFYGVEQTEDMRDRVWGWIQDPAHEVEGLCAAQGGALVGFAHYRPFARPLAAGVGGFLDDLYVAPEARGSGAARELIDAVAEQGRARGWGMIRWITKEDNYRARGLYDQVADQTWWKTYDLKL